MSRPTRAARTAPRRRALAPALPVEPTAAPAGGLEAVRSAVRVPLLLVEEIARRPFGAWLVAPLVLCSSVSAQELDPSLAEPAPAPSPEPDDPLSRLQYEFVANTTARWQVDNGDSSEFFNSVGSGAAACETSEQCGGGLVCFQGTCRGLNAQYDPSGENFGDLVTTFGGTVRYEELVATARFDTALYLRPPEAAVDASEYIRSQLAQRYENQLQAEYLSLAYASKHLEITLGDFYVTLGRGLVLGVRIVDDLAIDNKLRGGEAKAHVGPFDLHFFYGFLNIKNFEPGTGFAYRDTNDQIGGARIEYAFGRALKVGLHGASIRTPVIDDNQTEFLNLGATLELPRLVSWASAYAEIAHIDRKRLLGENRRLFEQEGLGIYGNVNLFFGPLTLLLEGKMYDNLLNILPGDATSELAQRRQNINRLSEPPTAERFGATILTNNTVVGGRGRVDWAIVPEVVPYVSYGHYNENGCGVFGFRGRSAALDEDAECDDELGVGANVSPKSYINAVFGGARVRWGGGDASAEAGYRGQYFFGRQTADAGPGASFSRISIQESHVLLDVHQRLGSFNSEVYFLGKALAQPDNDWLEGRVALSLGHDDGWTVTGAYEYTSISPNSREHYPSVAGQWRLSPSVVLRGLVGGERPGLKCSGGACRFFPGFEGGRLEVSLRL